MEAGAETETQARAIACAGAGTVAGQVLPRLVNFRLSRPVSTASGASRFTIFTKFIDIVSSMLCNKKRDKCVQQKHSIVINTVLIAFTIEFKEI